MKLAIFIILSAFFTASYAQEIPILTDNSIPGIEKITTRNFDYDGLWGYINGGADLYFEYGFKSVTVQDIRINGSDFKVDIYCMESPEAAYGIYSVSRFRCLYSNLLNENDCVTPYQYIAAKGNYFLSIANNTGSEPDQEKSLKIARKYLDQVDEARLQVPEIFSHSLFDQGLDYMKLILGPLGMQNGFVRWDGLFAEFSDYEVWVMPVEVNDTRFNIGFIKYENEEFRDRFITGNDIAVLDPADLEPSEKVKRFAFIMQDGMLLYDGKLPEKLLRPLREMAGGS